MFKWYGTLGSKTLVSGMQGRLQLALPCNGETKLGCLERRFAHAQVDAATASSRYKVFV